MHTIVIDIERTIVDVRQDPRRFRQARACGELALRTGLSSITENDILKLISCGIVSHQDEGIRETIGQDTQAHEVYRDIFVVPDWMVIPEC